MYYDGSIEDLKAKVQEYCADPRYENLRKMWSRHHKGDLVEKIPLLADTNPRTWATALKYDPDKFSSDDNEKIARFQLERKIFEHENIHDDCVQTPDIGKSTGLEKPRQPRKNYVHSTGAWLDNPIINEPEDLEKLKKSGYNPGAWGPMRVACSLRGTVPLMIDMVTNPEFVHELMEFITSSKINSEQQQAKAKGVDIKTQRGHLHEDDVNCLLISPKHYEEFIFPYEKRIAEIYGKVSFHSCGKLTPILDLIASLPGLFHINVSPWTDLEQAVKKLPDYVFLQVEMHPESDIVRASNEEIKARIKNIKATCGHRLCEIHAVSLHGVAMEPIINWVNVAQPETWRN